MNKIIFIFLLISTSFVYAEKPNNCDILAADPYIKPLPYGVKGIELDSIESEKAIFACKKAIKSFPEETRYIYQLGRAFDVKKDYSNALDHYFLAAKKGNRDAQYKVGFICEWPWKYQKNAKSDKKEAFIWYEKAAKQEHSEAQLVIGKWFRDGGYNSPVKKDCKKALEWLKKSAAQKNRRAYEVLGVMYSRGTCVEVDDRKAFDWHLKGAKNGNTSSKEQVAKMYAEGKGIEKNHLKAVMWYEDAVSESETYYKYQDAIGSLYYNGNDCSFQEQYFKLCKQGVDYGLGKNYKEAFKWYMKAALQGYNSAQKSIYEMYLNGKGVRKNYIKAYAWLSLAKSDDEGNDKVSEMLFKKRFEELEAKMTPQQIALAQEYNPIKENQKKSNFESK